MAFNFGGSSDAPKFGESPGSSNGFSFGTNSPVSFDSPSTSNPIPSSGLSNLQSTPSSGFGASASNNASFGAATSGNGGFGGGFGASEGEVKPMFGQSSTPAAAENPEPTNGSSLFPSGQPSYGGQPSSGGYGGQQSSGHGSQASGGYSGQSSGYGGGGGGGVCFDFQKGRCTRGEGCRYRHTMEGARPQGGGGGYGGGGGQMGALGASLNDNITWDLTKLAVFEKNFYMEHPHVTAMSEPEVVALRKKADMTCVGADVPKPVRTFEEASFPVYVLEEIKKLGFAAPTAIQMQGWPMALSGRDMIGIAATGSGKTLAFLLPGIVHINAQVSFFVCWLFSLLYFCLFFFYCLFGCI